MRLSADPPEARRRLRARSRQSFLVEPLADLIASPQLRRNANRMITAIAEGTVHKKDRTPKAIRKSVRRAAFDLLVVAYLWHATVELGALDSPATAPKFLSRVAFNAVRGAAHPGQKEAMRRLDRAVWIYRSYVDVGYGAAFRRAGIDVGRWWPRYSSRCSFVGDEDPRWRMNH
jgi:hypothetical protein